MSFKFIFTLRAIIIIEKNVSLMRSLFLQLKEDLDLNLSVTKDRFDHF